MTLVIYAQLIILALIDSTSIGTLLIPLWLLLRADTHRLIPRLLLYLGVLGGFYLVVGIAVLNGAQWLIRGLGADSLTQIPTVQWLMAIAGAALLGYALMAKPAGKSAGASTNSSEPRWQKRFGTALRSPGGMMGLALLAGLLELPTMVPYLVAIGFLSNSTLALGWQTGVLVVYCCVMLVPALLLLGLRVRTGVKLDPFLQRAGTKLGKFASESLLWILGIVGFLLLRTALSALAPAAVWNPFK